MTISVPGKPPVKTDLKTMKPLTKKLSAVRTSSSPDIKEAEEKLKAKASAPVLQKERQGDMLRPKNVGGVAGDRLTQYIERVERLEEEKSGLADDIRDVYAEVKSAGFETKIVRQLIKLRKMDHQKRIEHEELLDLYKSAIGLE